MALSHMVSKELVCSVGQKSGVSSKRARGNSLSLGVKYLRFRALAVVMPILDTNSLPGVIDK